MPADLLAELKQIQSDSSEIEERFYKDLEFGTGGMRGVIGAGTNRLNIYTVRRAALGIARYLGKKAEAEVRQGVAIAYDSRKYSREFAQQMSDLLSRTGIKVHLFPEIAPTPLLSFAIRHLQASAGLVLTASHNPPEYNGIKVYNQEGGQITEEDARGIYEEIQAISDPLVLSIEELFSQGDTESIVMIGNDVIEAYSQRVEQLLCQRQLIAERGGDLTIVYTPLHGTGATIIPDILKRVGFTKVCLVEEQATADPRFPTVKAPNPEEPQAFELALKLATELQADLIMATDPDADRLGVLVKTGTKYEMVNGNQLGALILSYLLEQSAGKDKDMQLQKGLVLKTIVTSDLGERIAESYGVETFNTLTGFKYIGEKIEECCKTGSHTFIFGYEESYGYLAGDFVRDKDAVQMTILVAEMALYYQQQSKGLFQVLDEIYSRFGYYREELHSFTATGKEGRLHMEESIEGLRENPPSQMAGIAVSVVEDYELQVRTVMETGRTEPLLLPRANVMKIILADASWMTVRPSGTEPKMKVYLSTNAHTKEEADKKISLLRGAMHDLIRFS
ncbi:phospho-sugar mutase [Brevibacillus choshinensis]|uniref:Phosphoglucomutase n=1 Tax=Brevibacillus choshinensis TaxID=54911 RepID=A0ABX7FJ38_BRECH|nr:phospho-sugar mutase [Brevibacillus choshinensis]QRG66244.1 phospho-sugar mutase [Brevibacillus choshinensis]